ncbi:leucine-rich repeat domain-containing protein [Tenacibaculum sp. S7007]|uniref:Leucine-rich repeat domain-containing protein n=1 Tax=Tenacibaculum pelagium TaxID=2759527 RepID=A0A839ARC4_9FLAO|nr:leucine-rich repeat domain-containing protein [Tenacibaculum pelagium]MBA6157197.1 leucine-rich repeat domain-containing protein [Tenacibaculum pelagium]
MRKYLLIICLICLSSCIKNLTDEELIETYQESINNHKWKKALDCVKEGLIRKPTDTSLYFSQALCLKNINPIKNHQEVLTNINIYLNHYKTSSRGRLLKYINYYENDLFTESIEEVERIEKYYGISAITLLMKANAHFLNKDYKNAAFNYEEATMYPNSIEKFKAIYYYKIYSKYFAGNKEGASWDTAFLENYGLEEDMELMSLISKDQLNIDDYNKIPFYAESENFDKEIRLKINLSYDRLFKPIYTEKLFYEPRKTVKDLKNLDKNLELLNLSSSNISELPDNIKVFKKLKALDLSRNRIKDFDKLFNQLGELPSLEYLELDYSNLKEFPSSISKLQKLKGLSIEASNIRKLPPEIGTLKNLGYLSIRNNGKIKDLPKEIKYLKNLNCLDVSGSGIQRLREEVGLCYNLISIKSNASKVKTIPHTIGNLKNLRSLNLGFNRIETIPKSIGDINYLTNLDLGSNEIRELPKTIKNLQNLQMLSIEFNRFRKFPSEVLELKNLQTLWLHNNNIPHLPTDIGNLTKLTHLLIDHEVISDKNINQIKERNTNIYIVREDCRKYVGGIKRKK